MDTDKNNGKTNREVIEETTSGLRESAKDLAEFCRSISSAQTPSSTQDRVSGVSLQHESSNLDKNLRILFDEIDEFYDGIITIKNALGGVHVNEVAVLEADLGSILKDLYDAKVRNDWTYITTLVERYLVDNFEQWYRFGLPALIRSRDS